MRPLVRIGTGHRPRGENGEFGTITYGGATIDHENNVMRVEITERCESVLREQACRAAQPQETIGKRSPTGGPASHMAVGVLPY
jgi:hypothetical protein